MAKYAAKFSQTTLTTTFKTAGALRAPGSSMRRIKLYDLLFGAGGTPADNVLEFNLSRTSANGTDTAVTPLPLDPADAAAVSTSISERPIAGLRHLVASLSSRPRQMPVSRSAPCHRPIPVRRAARRCSKNSKPCATLAAFLSALAIVDWRRLIPLPVRIVSMSRASRRRLALKTSADIAEGVTSTSAPDVQMPWRAAETACRGKKQCYAWKRVRRLGDRMGFEDQPRMFINVIRNIRTGEVVRSIISDHAYEQVSHLVSLGGEEIATAIPSEVWLGAGPDHLSRHAEISKRLMASR
jgi:hypothetical protein